MANEHDVMQMAVEHVAVAEEAAQEGDGPKARLHTEMAKGLTSMARELRIGNGNTGSRRRGDAYRDVVLKPVIVNPPGISAEDGDDEADAALEGGSDPLRDGADDPVPAPAGGTGPFA